MRNFKLQSIMKKLVSWALIVPAMVLCHSCQESLQQENCVEYHEFTQMKTRAKRLNVNPKESFNSCIREGVYYVMDGLAEYVSTYNTPVSEMNGAEYDALLNTISGLVDEYFSTVLGMSEEDIDAINNYAPFAPFPEGSVLPEETMFYYTALRDELEDYIPHISIKDFSYDNVRSILDSVPRNPGTRPRSTYDTYLNEWLKMALDNNIYIPFDDLSNFASELELAEIAQDALQKGISFIYYTCKAGITSVYIVGYYLNNSLIAPLTLPYVGEHPDIFAGDDDILLGIDNELQGLWYTYQQSEESYNSKTSLIIAAHDIIDSTVVNTVNFIRTLNF